MHFTLPSLQRVSLQEKVDFAKNLHVMLQSGIPINDALTSLGEQMKDRPLGAILLHVRGSLEKGTALSEAFGKERDVFGNVFISLLKTGEKSGTLEENLAFLATWLERDNDLKRKIQAATLYPKIIFTAAVLLSAALVTFILPKLEPLFRELHVALPLPTRILLGTSVFLAKFWIPVVLGIIAAVVFFRFSNRVRAVRRVFDSLYLKLPFFADLLRDYQLGLISQLLYTLFKSGIPLTEALTIASGAATNVRYQESIAVLYERAAKGTKLSEAMGYFPALYPPNLIMIIGAGEKSGSLEKSFEYLSEFYAQEVDNTTKKLPTVIEPILLVLIGLVVGLIALAILSPIYDLVSTLQK